MIHAPFLPPQKLCNFLILRQPLLTIVLPQNLKFPMVSWPLLLVIHCWEKLATILPLHLKHPSLTWAMVLLSRVVFASLISLNKHRHPLLLHLKALFIILCYLIQTPEAAATMGALVTHDLLLVPVLVPAISPSCPPTHACTDDGQKFAAALLSMHAGVTCYPEPNFRCAHILVTLTST